MALSFLTTKEKVVLVNCGAEDILRGNQTITLGLVWTLILKYQFRTEAKGESAQALILPWCNIILKDYGFDAISNVQSEYASCYIRPCTHVSSLMCCCDSLQDGRVLQAIVDSLEKGLVNFKLVNI